MKYWMALVGSHMGEIVCITLVSLIGIVLVGVIAFGIGRDFGVSHPYLKTYSTVAGVILAIWGMIRWNEWSVDNKEKIKEDVEKMGKLLKEQAEILESVKMPPAKEPWIRDEPWIKKTEKGFETNNTRIIANLSNQVEHFQTLSWHLESEKNAALEEANKYKDLYEKLIFSQKLVVDSLTRENEDLKERLSRGGTNAIMDLE